MKRARASKIRRKSRSRSGKPGRIIRFQKGNTAALKHGLRSKRAQLGLLPGQEDLRAMLSSRRQRLHDEEGGTPDMKLLLEDWLERYQRVWILATTLESRIEQEGIVTGKGRTRATVTLYLSLVDRLNKMAERLGFERKAKQVPSLEAFLQQREQGEQE
jgi:hypothetical protein